MLAATKKIMMLWHCHHIISTNQQLVVWLVRAWLLCEKASPVHDCTCTCLLRSLTINSKNESSINLSVRKRTNISLARPATWKKRDFSRSDAFRKINQLFQGVKSREFGKKGQWSLIPKAREPKPSTRMLCNDNRLWYGILLLRFLLLSLASCVRSHVSVERTWSSERWTLFATS